MDTTSLQTQLMPLVERVQGVIADMSPRDRVLALAMMVAFSTATILGTLWWMSSSLSSLESRIDQREDDVAFIDSLITDYKAATTQLEGLNSKLEQNAATDLSSFLEQAADQSAIREKLTSVREKSVITDETIEEKLYTVQLSELTTDELSSFIYQVETSGNPFKIRNTQVKTRTRKGERTLTLSMDISVFRPLQAEGE